MATFEQIINSSTLDVVVPNVTVDFPTNDSNHGAWLQKLTSHKAERQRAFFGTSREFDIFCSLLISSSCVGQTSPSTFSSFFAWSNQTMHPPTPRTRPLPSYPSSLVRKCLTMPHTYLPPRFLHNPRLESVRRHAPPLLSQLQATAPSTHLLTSFR